MISPAVKNKAIIIGTSTVIGFLGDVTMYSIAASKGKKFKFQIPEGKALAQVLVIGVLTGVVIDLLMTRITEQLALEEERNLDKLVKQEKKKIYEGQIKGQTPQKIVWI